MKSISDEVPSGSFMGDHAKINKWIISIDGPVDIVGYSVIKNWRYAFGNFNIAMV